MFCTTSGLGHGLVMSTGAAAGGGGVTGGCSASAL
jgi:hypothetical protein